MAEQKTKQPREVLDFDFDATRRLAVDEVIDRATITYAGPDSALVLANVTWSDVRAKGWFSAGTDGARYKVTGLITTTGGRILEKEFELLVREL